jgi:hypothetical protein
MRTTIFCALGCWGLWAAACCVSAAEATTAKPAEAKFTLRYHFQPGQVLRWDVLQQSVTQASAATSSRPRSGQHESPSGYNLTSQSSESVSRSTKVWRIKQVDPDGSATFEHMVEDVQMKQVMTYDGKAKTSRYNSKTDPTPPPGFETVAGAVGSVLSVIHLDPQGNVISRKSLHVKGSAENNGQITLPLPAEAIPLGHVWTNRYEMELPLPNGTVKKVQLQQKFVLQDVQTGVATIAVSTQILTPIQDPVLEAQLMQTETAGHVKFDLDAGRVIQQQVDVDKRIVGFRGAASSLHYLNRFTEQYLPEPVRVAETKGQRNRGTEGQREEGEAAKQVR